MEIKGIDTSNVLIEKYKSEIDRLKNMGVMPCLSIVRVGNREDDLAYERGILKRFEKAQVKVNITELPEDVTQLHLERILQNLDEDNSVHGVLLFRPLPKHLNENAARNMISARKDVDCMSDANFAHVFAQDGMGYPPCTPEACIEILKNNNIELAGKNVVVIGRSMVVGKPLAMLLLKENATVTVCHTKTKDIEKKCQEADIICAAAGCANMVTADFVKKGQVVVDVGINMVDGKLCGDVNFAQVSEIVDAITPVPGGVGSLTTTMLLKHVLKSAGANI